MLSTLKTGNPVLVRHKRSTQDTAGGALDIGWCSRFAQPGTALLGIAKAALPSVDKAFPFCSALHSETHF